MAILAFDGSCKGNGKADCMSAGGVFVSDEGHYSKLASVELNSTNQRGELQGLLLALEWIANADTYDNRTVVITDSKYICDTINKEWYVNWQMKDWITSSGTKVKNQDLWEHAVECLDKIEQLDREFSLFHVKGHIITLGPVTCNKLVNMDHNGYILYKAFKAHEAKPEKLQLAYDKFLEHNGEHFADVESIMTNIEEFCCMNATADVIAVDCLAKAVQARLGESSE